LIMVFLPSGLLPALQGLWERTARRRGETGGPGDPVRAAGPPPAVVLARSLASSLRLSSAKGGGEPTSEHTRRQ
jgi:hypothetical protein